MSRYVDKEKLLKVIWENSYILSDAYNSRSYGMFTKGIEQAVDECIVDNVAEVRHEVWIKPSEFSEPICSLCAKSSKSQFGLEYDYCPHCGARMDGKINEEEIQKAMCVHTAVLSSLEPGSKFKLNRSSSLYVVLEHTENGTFVVSEDGRSIDFGKTNNWKLSNIRDSLNAGYYNMISAIVGKENIILTKRDLSSLDGVSDYGTCMDFVTILSHSEYVKYRSVLTEKYWDDSTYLLTPWSCTKQAVVCKVEPDKTVSDVKITDDITCKPAFTLKSDITVYDQ